MDSARSTKRRKLDTPAKSNAAPAPSRRNKSTLQTGLTSHTPQRGKREALTESWAAINEAKQSTTSSRTELHNEADVYEDIEGAHSTPLLVERRGPSGKLRRKNAVLSAEDNGNVGTGTRERDHDTPKSAKHRIQQTRQAFPNAELGLEELDSGGSHDVDELARSPSAQKPAIKRRPAANQQVIALDKPRKTFEDEIKELENEGRRLAARDETANRSTRLRKAARDGGRYTKLGSPSESSKLSPGKTLPASTSCIQRQRRQQENIAENLSVHHDDSDYDSRHDSMEMTINTPDGESAQIGGTAREAQHLHPSPKLLGSLSKVIPASSATVEDHQVDQRALYVLQKVLMEKSTGKRPISLVGLDDEYANIATVVEQTIIAGESNSMLVIGARGSGKTSLVNQVLREQAAQHADDFLVVRLNGFIHTDDKVALREIWRQLGRDMEMDDESTAKNSADTLATLLALLSHPSEHGQEDANQVTKSVIFILDEFELFATHPRQTLLYNLFDIAQSRKAPIAVLGLTTRFGVAESLEKRVKSRFSHRLVHLSLAKSLPAFEEVCTAALRIQTIELNAGDNAVLAASNKGAEKLSKASKEAVAKPGLVERWNSLVDQLIKSETISALLQHVYYTSKSIPAFLAFVAPALASISMEALGDISILSEHFTSASNRRDSPDSKLSMLHSMSTLQMALLISAARLTNIHSTENVAFPLVYEEYKMLASKAKLQASASGAMAQGAGGRVWSKAVSKGAWESLTELGLVLEDGRGGGKVDVGLEEIGASGAELGNWSRWCREI